ncbi:hypothetical protein N7517_011248 [Penicillium concentricum]|uniref:Secreted protein CSS2 C-terminal domain-containing protein n=1 Tax=Penicillium concentricum TaxID=293559 RepID=A0A9W9RC75_9EURO|nr:uncharacterized protein N7517_011248 [Penicillium concentricum]KAJ5356639.1 hypothetical protein N7517_011248 [Penicillium concentricum]
MLLPKIMIAACCLSTSTLAATWPSSIAGLPDNLAETPTAATDYVSQWAKFLTNTIKEIYNPETCDLMSGTYEDMKWSWQSADSECDMETQRDTISGAVKHYMTNEDNREHRRDCDTQCLRIDATSYRNGWLKLGPVDRFDEKAYCGPALTFHSYFGSDKDCSEQHVL